MSLPVQQPQIIDVTPAIELAKRMTEEARAPEQALRALFTGAMQKIEKQFKTKFDEAFKERVWSQVSKERLQFLKECLFLEFSNKTLRNFTAKEVEEMLEEYKKKGSIKSEKYRDRITKACQLNYPAIIDAVVSKAGSMVESWDKEIIGKVRELRDASNINL